MEKIGGFKGGFAPIIGMKIEFVNFSGGLGKTPFLKNLNLEISSPGVFCLLGPNGSGKTTFLNSIMGNASSRFNEIKIDGKNVFETPKGEIAKKTSFIPAEFLPTFDFTVGEFTLFARLAIKGNFWETEDDVKTVDTALKEAGVYHLKEKKLCEISSGEKQMVFLAQVIVKNTEIILMDEPVSHLDLKHKSALFKKIKSFAGKIIILSLHELNDAFEVADEFILMKEGRVFTQTKNKNINEKILTELYETEIKIIEIAEGRKLAVICEK